MTTLGSLAYGKAIPNGYEAQAYAQSGDATACTLGATLLVGLVPAWGGCTEMLLRHSHARRRRNVLMRRSCRRSKGSCGDRFINPVVRTIDLRRAAGA